MLAKGWTHRFRTFVELGLEHIAPDEDGGTQGNWNAGGAVLLNDGAQLDAALSIGATSSTVPFSVTVGYSRRSGP